MSWFMPAVTLIFASLAVAALVSHLGGNPTAINGVIGGAFGTAVFAVLWWMEANA